MRYFLTLLSISFACCAWTNGQLPNSKPVKFKSSALKKALGLSNYNMSDLDIAGLIVDTSTVTNTPAESSAVVYKLYGTASQHSDQRVSNLFVFDEPLPTQEILLKSKEYLQVTGMCHTNESVRSYAFITLGTAFKGDAELGEWLAEQYFFSSNPIHQDVFYLEVIRIGGFTGKNAKLCIQDAMHSQSYIKVLGAIKCIADNPDVYEDFLPDLIVTTRKADTLFKGLGYVRSYRNLIRALRRYGEEVAPYMKHLELMKKNCSDSISQRHIDSYLNSLK